MRKLIFFNNASFKLAEELLAYGGNPVVMDRSLSEANINMPDVADGFYTTFTITHPSLPGVHEILHISEVIDEGDYGRLFGERAKEGTEEQDWPVGSLVECRVTAGMLHALSANTIYSAAQKSYSSNGGDAVVDYGEDGDKAMLSDAWAIGGLPVAPARGFGEYSQRSTMATSVEGVGYSNAVELGVAPNFVPDQDYFPGNFAKDTASPFWTYGYKRGGAFSGGSVEFGDPPWERYAPETDSNIVSFQRIEETDVWFYPTEIGFICEAYSASSVPTIAVKEVDRYGDPVGDLIASKALTGVGQRLRIVLANNITKGIKGMNFVRITAAGAGTCRGRFYWKGFFICSNSKDGYPSGAGSIGGEPLI